MKIVQISVVYPQGNTHPEIYGLGEDNKMYMWINRAWQEL